MQGPAHGAIVAGVNSAVVAGWVRKNSIQQFDPYVDPPSVRDRLTERAPLLLAGLGFTGLSTAVAYGFDKIEMWLLQDYESDLHYMQQGGNHHKLHKLPYLGAGIGAAHLIKHSSAKFGRWIAEQTNSSELITEVVDELESLANWMIDSVGTGVLGHLVSDIPTSGRGGTALRLLSPITNQNFCLQLVKSASENINGYLFLAGGILSAAAWGISGVYATSWEPPERRIGGYVETLRDCDGYAAALRKIWDDLTDALSTAVGVACDTIWELPIFASSAASSIGKSVHNLFNFDFDPKLLGVDEFSKDALLDQGVLPSDIEETLTSSSLYSTPVEWPMMNEVPLVITDECSLTESNLFTPQAVSDDFDQSATNLFRE